MMDLTVVQHEELRQAVEDFKAAMAVRSSLNLRVARRVTAILRVGMVSMGVVAIIFLFLLLVLTSKITYMIDVIDTMNKQFTSMASDMGAMRGVIVQMDQHVAALPVIVQEIETMKGSVSSLNHNINNIAARMKVIDDSLTGITYNVGNMTTTFRVMDGHVNGIGQDVQRMSRPMKLFNSMTLTR
ncbi:MAG: hypothetical protein HQL60_06335 [Magnetococcales bacterium]|nr:hypothetical protein [Magnetococcales bacterium]